MAHSIRGPETHFAREVCPIPGVLEDAYRKVQSSGLLRRRRCDCFAVLSLCLPKSVYLARCTRRHMNSNPVPMNHRGFCIFINTLFEGAVPSVYESGVDDHPNASERLCLFTTELEAQREIADFMMTRIQQFLDGERDFQDAITVEEYVVEVEVLPDGSIVDPDGKIFPKTRQETCRCISKSTRRYFCGWVFLASLPEAFQHAREQPGILVEETFQQSGTRSAGYAHTPKTRLERQPHLGTRIEKTQPRAFPSSNGSCTCMSREGLRESCYRRHAEIRNSKSEIRNKFGGRSSQFPKWRNTPKVPSNLMNHGGTEAQRYVDHGIH